MRRHASYVYITFIHSFVFIYSIDVGIDDMFHSCMGIQLESIQPAPKIAHLRNLYEASVTAALFMIITFEVPNF